MQFLSGDHSLDTGRRELRRGSALIAVEPQVFDLLVYLVENRTASSIDACDRNQTAVVCRRSMLTEIASAY